MLKHQVVSTRAATSEDVQSIAKIHVLSWKMTYKGLLSEQFLSELNVEFSAAKWKDRLTTNPLETMVAVQRTPGSNDEIVGFISAGKANDADLAAMSDAGAIIALYVLPEVLGRGIGAEMMLRGEQRLKEQGYKRIYISYMEGNTRAEKFYKNFGYVLDTQKVPESRKFVSPITNKEEYKQIIRVAKLLS